jgi:hypothetical protein
VVKLQSQLELAKQALKIAEKAMSDATERHNESEAWQESHNNADSLSVEQAP